MKIIVIGALPIQGDSSTFGGTTVLLQTFLDYLDQTDQSYELIQLNDPKVRSQPLQVVSAILTVLRASREHKVVMLNGANSSTFYLSPFIWLAARLSGRKFVFRKFGGSFDVMYTSAAWWKRMLLQYTIFNSDLFYVETQRLKVWLENQTVKNVRWFPNVRECPSDEKDAKVYKKRLVYIGSVKETKGIKVIIDTAKKLDKSYTVDVYGPLDDCSIKKASFDHSSVVYKGVLRPVQVPSVLAKYDLLLLPTKHPGEGYPGVVIEAFSVGVVAIATRWGGIPELIDDQVNGVLMDGFETSALLEALAKVSSTNYERLSRGARESFDVFDATLVHKRVLFEINELHN